MKNWNKLGLVYAPSGATPWALHSALTPTPVKLRDGRLRVYAGFRDVAGVSRIGWVDLDPDDPTRVLNVSTTPALDCGRAGCFDDNGVILGDVVQAGPLLRMYYVGFQLVGGVKFLAFTGVAESADGGDTFVRLSETPALDRSNEGLYIRAIHTAMYVDGRWRIWYAAGSGWSTIGGRPYPQYHVCTTQSDDGLTFGPRGSSCIRGVGSEYRLGRPRVWESDGGFHMLFTYGTLEGAYLPGYAFSTDGITWTRNDEVFGLAPGPEEWDSRTLCYAAPIRIGDRTFVFYNGNDMGRAGFGCALLTGLPG